MYNIYKMRWKYDDCPFPIKSREIKPKIHPEIHHFGEMPDDQKKFLLTVKNYINSILPEARLFLYGSRAKGTWDEYSDYDIIVLTKEEKEKIDLIRKKKFEVKVDLCFVTEYSSEQYIEIKD